MRELLVSLPRDKTAADLLAESLPPSERLIFHGESVFIGQVRCPPTATHFRNCGETRTFCMVFPRSSVIIRRPDERPFVEDPTVVTFYNRAQEYERFELSPQGDRCDWFAYSQDVVRDAIRQVDPYSAGDENRPLRVFAARSTADVYRRQRLLFEQVKHDEAIEPLYVEESAVGLLAEVVGEMYGRGLEVETPSQRAYELTEAARRLLTLRYAQSLRLTQIARELETSVFHLCRVFRRVHGSSIHRYRTQLRIRRAMERLSKPDADLGQLAFELGFSTHSHFTAAFKRAFGATPSTIRSTVSHHAQKRSFSAVRTLSRATRTESEG